MRLDHLLSKEEESRKRQYNKTHGMGFEKAWLFNFERTTRFLNSIFENCTVTKHIEFLRKKEDKR